MISFIRLLLVLLIFPCLTALSVNFIFSNAALSGLFQKLDAQCIAGQSSNIPYLLSYTGLDRIDTTLCVLVTVFQTLMVSSTSSTFLTYFLGTGGPFLVLPIVEAYRTGQSRLLAYPLIWGLASQTVSIGATSTVYCLTLLLFGGVAKGRKSSLRMITQADAEAIVFGIIAGEVIPTAAMLILRDPYVTAIWQIYPVYVYAAHFLHLQFRPASRYSQSGYRTIQALFIGCFIISSSVHISIVWPMISDYATLRAFFIPSLSVLEPSTDLTLQVFDFLKWDFTFSFFSVAIASLWFASNMKQLVAIIAWYIVATPTIGFGAAITGVAIWRDSILQDGTN